MALELTPRCGAIAAMLTLGIGPSAFPIEKCGAVDAPLVGRQSSTSVSIGYGARATIDGRLTSILLKEECDTMPTRYADIHSKLDQVNRFLADIYQDIQRLSDVLHKAGVRDEAIIALRRHHLPSYISQLCHRWQSFIVDALPERHADIVIRRYSLNGELPSRLADLGVEYGISRERVRQLELAGIKRLRSRRRRQMLQQIALEVAYEVTGLPPEELCKPMDASQEAVLSVTKNADHMHDKQELGTISDELTEQEESLTDKGRIHPEYVIAVRQKHPKAYARWTIKEEERLRELFSGGMDITALASIFERQPSAIQARLTKLGLLQP